MFEISGDLLVVGLEDGSMDIWRFLYPEYPKSGSRRKNGVYYIIAQSTLNTNIL